MIFIENPQYNYFSYIIDTTIKNEYIATIKKNIKEKNNNIIQLNYKNEKELIHFTGYTLESLIDNIKFWLHLNNFKIIFNN